MTPRLIPKPEPDAFPADTDRIIAVCRAHGHVITRPDALRVWYTYSEDMAANWLTLPRDDERLLTIIARYTLTVDVA